MTGDLAVAYRAPTEAELKGQLRVFFFFLFFCEAHPSIPRL